MTPWAPVSLALLFDLRVRPLSWAERGVLHHIHLIAAASPDGITAAIEKRTGEADAAAWKRALGEDGASHLGRLVEAGWFTICPEGVRLAARSASDAPRAPVGPPPKAPDATAADPAEGARMTPPEAAARLRKLRYAFNHRLGEFAGIDPATTWEVWSASECGRDAITRRVTNPPTTRERNASGTFQGRSVDATERFGNVPGTPRNATERTTERPRNGSRASENALKEENKRENDRNARERSGNATERTTERSGVPTAKTTPSILGELQAAAKGLVLIGSAEMEREANEMLSRLSPPPSVDEIAEMGAALSAPAAWWPQSGKGTPKRITLRDLAGWRPPGGSYEWAPFLALVAVARSRVLRRNDDLPPPPPPLPVNDAPPLTPEQMRAIRPKAFAGRDFDRPARRITDEV